MLATTPKQCRLQSAKSICQCAKFVRRNDQAKGRGEGGRGEGARLVVEAVKGAAACLRRDVNQRFKCFLSCQRQRGNFVYCLPLSPLPSPHPLPTPPK